QAFASRVGGARWASRDLEGDVVHVAEEPLLARFARLDERVAFGVEVGGRVPAGGVVAAADVPAFEASAQVDPVTTGCEALDAAGATRSRIDRRVEVGA